MIDKTSPIGIFDSGVGGLTIMNEVIKLMPHENIIYFGDTKRMPYGPKSKELLIKYSQEISDFLIKKGVKVIVIACGSASSNAYQFLKENYNFKIFEVITPAINIASKLTKNNKIGIIGTQSTIASKAHENALLSINSNFQIYGKACPLFAPMVEESWYDNEITKLVATEYLKDFTDIDSLILGCTHYPLLYKTIEKILPNVNIIDPSKEIAISLKNYLDENNLLNKNKPIYKIYTTDEGNKFNDMGKIILRDIPNHMEILKTRECLDNFNHNI